MADEKGIQKERFVRFLDEVKLEGAFIVGFRREANGEKHLITGIYHMQIRDDMVPGIANLIKQVSKEAEVPSAVFLAAVACALDQPLGKIVHETSQTLEKIDERKEG